MRASMALIQVSRMCSPRDLSFAVWLLNKCANRKKIVSKAGDRPGMRVGGEGVGVEQVGFTFDERGFGFVDGHGGFEEPEVGGTETPWGGIATWIPTAAKVTVSSPEPEVSPSRRQLVHTIHSISLT